MKLGAVDYLPKPFTPEQVRNVARRAVKRDPAALAHRRQIIEVHGGSICCENGWHGRGTQFVIQLELDGAEDV